MPTLTNLFRSSTSAYSTVDTPDHTPGGAGKESATKSRLTLFLPRCTPLFRQKKKKIHPVFRLILGSFRKQEALSCAASAKAARIIFQRICHSVKRFNVN